MSEKLCGALEIEKRFIECPKNSNFEYAVHSDHRDRRILVIVLVIIVFRPKRVVEVRSIKIKSLCEQETE